MDIPEKLATQDEDKQTKNTTQHVLDTTIAVFALTHLPYTQEDTKLQVYTCIYLFVCVLWCPTHIVFFVLFVFILCFAYLMSVFALNFFHLHARKPNLEKLSPSDLPILLSKNKQK
jgi:hypothetical protein